LHDVGWYGRSRRGFVPAGGDGPVPYVLLVEGVLWAAGFPLVGGPEAGRVGGQHLVAEGEDPVGVPAELEFRVGHEEAAFGGVLGALPVDAQSQVAKAFGGFPAYAGDDVVERHGQVVAGVGLRGGGEDRFGEFAAFHQAGRERHAAHGGRSPVLLQGRAGEVTAGHALHLDHGEGAASDGPAGELGGYVGGRDQVVGDDVAEPLEPPHGQLGQRRALVGDGGGQWHVVDRDAVGGDQQQVTSVGVQVADLARVQVLHARHRSCPSSRGRRGRTKESGSDHLTPLWTDAG